VRLSERVKNPVWQLWLLVKWTLYSCGVGMIVGIVAVAFHYGIAYSTQLRAEHPRMIWLLPSAGITIVMLYRICKMEKDRGTNFVLVAVREAEPMKLRTAPLIFLSTIITHAAGGSAGREGAALQLGGSLAASVGRAIRLDEHDSRVMVMCGMSAAFSALFGTPITAAVFAMEVVSVGRMYYAAIVPCLAASLAGVQVAQLCGVHPHLYPVAGIPALTPSAMLQVILLGGLCAVLSIFFCQVMHAAPKIYGKINSTLLRATIGGFLVLGLTLLVGNQDYNGAGMPVIARCFENDYVPYAFLMKMIFTAATLGAGFKGGEIVPSFVIGGSFGCLFGNFVGFSPALCTAAGMGAVFCGVTNCPITSLLICFELFGYAGMPYYISERRNCMRLLLAEDEKDLSRALTAILQRSNYSVDAVYDGEEALAYVNSNNYDGLILDIMMPKLDGLTVLKTLRNQGNPIPILLLTAKSEIDDKVTGLDAGANDYLTKPFAAKELLARIRAMTREHTQAVSASLHTGYLTLDLASFSLSSPTGSFRLTNKEFQMLELLMRNPGQLISSQRFLERIWGYDSEVEINVVWVYISYLRKKFTALHADVQLKAARNAGYFLEELP